MSSSESSTVSASRIRTAALSGYGLYGYGEDALTFCALTDGLPNFLKLAGDATLAEDAMVLFRPSFGRRAYSRSGARAASFGEFDAIVATDQAVHLIEAKWSRSSEVYRPSLELRREQRRRHQVMRWYIERWRQAMPTEWAVFATDERRGEFEANFEGLTIPVAGSQLADNMSFVLDRIAPRGREIQDVLLYCDVDRRACPAWKEECGFRVVHICFEAAHVSGYFSMGRPTITAGSGT